MATKPLSDAVLRKTIQHYNKHKGNETKAATAAGVSRSTFQSRMRSARVRFPSLAKTFSGVKGGSRGLTDAQKAAAFAAFVRARYDRRAAGKELGLTLSGFDKRLQTYAAENGIDLKQLKPVATLEDDVAQHRGRAEESGLKTRLKSALTRITDLEDRLRDYEYAASASFTPAAWTLPTHPRRKHEHTPYLLTSDFQIGEVIRAEETEAGYGYDGETFRRRYRRMIDTTIYLSLEHSGKQWNYPGIIYARGGDTISGGLHEELRDTDDMTPIEAVECAFEEESAGIYKLADAFGRVEVKAPGAAGNHDRITMKPRTKKASAHSYDRIISYMLQREFRNDDRVTFQVSDSYDVYFNIYEQKILLTHGDRMGSGGGQGFIGPMATIMRGAQKVIMEQAALGRHVDRVDHGHFHTPGYNGWVLSNGCLPGYSEYAKGYRMRPSAPQQFLLYHHPKHGVVDIKPIILTEA